MNTNRAVIIGMFVFWAIAVALLVAGFISYENKKIIDSLQGGRSGGNNDVKGSLVQNLPVDQIELTLSVVAQHAVEEDCWMVISGSVYDVTSYIPMHPGGAQEIIKYCGQNGTEAFATKDKNTPKDHSAFAYSLLDKYFVGKIGDQIGTSEQVSVQTSDARGSTVNGVVTPQHMADTQTVGTTQTPSVSQTILSLSEVAVHNSETSCWMIMGTKVYDLTAYIPMHPGGKREILDYCGRDGAAAFAAVGHSSFAQSLLAKYYIGDVGTTVTTDPAAIINTNTTGGTTPTSNTIESQFPGATIINTESEDNGTQKIILRHDGDTYKVIVAVDGTIVKVEEEDD